MNQNRLYFFYGFLLIGFLVLAARLFELQIIFGAQNRLRAEGNRIRKTINPAPRGIVFDRGGRPLVRNVPVYRVKQLGDQTIGRSSKESFRTISREEALEMEAKGDTENLRTDVGRDYIYGSTLAHVLGYLGEANQEEVREGEYQLGDLVGRMGVEEQYDQILRGQDGGEIFEVDSQERKTKVLGEVKPVPGKDLFLSLDAELSRVAFEALGDEKAGAVVATEAKTGHILVLVSSPSFEPNLFTAVSELDHPEAVASILADPALPVFNRAVGGVYPPGSTFKMVTATAGVQEGKVDGETLYEDTGEIKIGEYSYKNWYFTQYGRTEGEVDLVKAIKRSTDTFFYKVGEWVGATKLSEWAKAFGLGRETGIDLPGEAVGLVPDPEWKEKVKGERWFLGNTYHFAIGQADLLATPLQVNIMTSVIANDGRLCRPKVRQYQISNIKYQDDSDSERIENSRQSRNNSKLKIDENCQDLKLKPETLRLITEGMTEACSEGGTAFPFFDFEIQSLPANESQHEPSTNSIEKASAKTGRVACKTGTAEFGDSAGRTHAWLTAFAPAEDPEIVITAVVEGGGEGAYVAAPIVKKVMEEWFKEKNF